MYAKTEKPFAQITLPELSRNDNEVSKSVKNLYTSIDFNKISCRFAAVIFLAIIAGLALTQASSHPAKSVDEYVVLGETPGVDA